MDDGYARKGRGIVWTATENGNGIGREGRRAAYKFYSRYREPFERWGDIVIAREEPFKLCSMK